MTAGPCVPREERPRVPREERPRVPREEPARVPREEPARVPREEPARVPREEPARVPREEQRRRTEQNILSAARSLFAERGFERTTIRAVARAAAVDPALVMQYFGSKDGLFAEAARWPERSQTVLQAAKQDVPAAALHDVFERFEGAGSEAALALLRNCLTYPDAGRVMRDEVMCERAAAVARIVGGPDAELRAGLVGACIIGVTLARHVLHTEPVASASRDDVERLLEPALRAIVEGPG